MKYLFVGGRFHGKKMEIEDPLPEVTFPNCPELYVFRRTGSGGVFVLHEMGYPDFIDSLIRICLRHASEVKVRKRRKTLSRWQRNRRNKFTDEDLNEASEANADLGSIFDEKDVRSGESLTRELIMAGMRMDGITFSKIGKRFGLHEVRAAQLLQNLKRKITEQKRKELNK